MAAVDTVDVRHFGWLTCAFACSYVLGLRVFARIGWPKQAVSEAASMVGGTAHSLLALAACVPLALREARVFSTQAGSAAELAEAGAAAACGLNPVGSAAALAPTFCYYSVDVFHYLLVNRGEPLFVVHHLAVLIMLATAMWTGRQALFPVYITTLLEAVTPFQMVWSYARDGRKVFPWLGDVYAAVSPFFTALYLFVRGAFGTVFMGYVLWMMLYSEGCRQNAHSAEMRYLFAFLMCGGYAGSMIWAKSLLSGYLRFRAKQAMSRKKTD